MLALGRPSGGDTQAVNRVVTWAVVAGGTPAPPRPTAQMKRRGGRLWLGRPPGGEEGPEEGAAQGWNPGRPWGDRLSGGAARGPTAGGAGVARPGRPWGRGPGLVAPVLLSRGKLVPSVTVTWGHRPPRELLRNAESWASRAHMPSQNPHLTRSPCLDTHWCCRKGPTRTHAHTRGSGRPIWRPPWAGSGGNHTHVT